MGLYSAVYSAPGVIMQVWLGGVQSVSQSVSQSASQLRQSGLIRIVVLHRPVAENEVQMTEGYRLPYKAKIASKVTLVQ